MRVKVGVRGVRKEKEYYYMFVRSN